MDRLCTVRFEHDTGKGRVSIESPVLDRQCISFGAQPALAGGKPTVIIQVFFLVVVPRADLAPVVKWVDGNDCTLVDYEVRMHGDSVTVSKKSDIKYAM